MDVPLLHVSTDHSGYRDWIAEVLAGKPAPATQRPSMGCNIKWYPAVPPGIEDIEGKVLDRVKAAN